MRPSSMLALLAVLVFASCEQAGGDGDSQVPLDSLRTAGCPSLETRQPEAPDQRPAFRGQTRACEAKSVSVDVTVIARGLRSPWAVEPLPGGDFLVAEQPGQMRVVSAAGVVGDPIAGVPAVVSNSQGGLLDVALSPSFDSDRTIYWSFTEARGDGNATSVARGVLTPDRHALEDVRVIFRSLPPYDGTRHFGSRLAFAPDGALFITLGERSDEQMRKYAQQKDSHLGKVVRINPDGSAPSDNPLAGDRDAVPEIWTSGHRNVQAAAFDGTGRLWVVEHGTRGGDELNLIEKGANYGWPLVAYGIEYGGDEIAGSMTSRAGFTQPVYYWDPVIAPSGAQFYSSSTVPEWEGSLFVGSLRGMMLVRVVLTDDNVTGIEHLLTDRQQRIRDVRQGHDGALYIVTDQENGELWRVMPRSRGAAAQ